MARREKNGQEDVRESGGRDYFWVKIVVGLVLVTVASLLISKLVVPRISAALGGGKTAIAGRADSSASALEQTGELVKEKREKAGGAKKKSGLTEEESGGEITRPEKPAAPVSTGVTIEKVESKEPESKDKEKKQKPEAAVSEKQKPAEKAEPKPAEKKERKPVAETEKAEEKKPVKEQVKEKPKAETKSAPAEKTAPLPKPAPAEKRETAAKQEKTTPAVKKEEKKEPEKPKEAAEKPAQGEKESADNENVVYVLQLGNFTSQENAEKMKKMLVDQYKIEVYIKKNDYQGEARFRVQAGAFKDRSNAEKFARELQIKGYNSYIAKTTLEK